MALNDLVAAQSTAKQSTKNSRVQLLDYLSTHSNAKIRHYKFPMMLQIYSDASYLSVPKARSRAVGFYFLSNNFARPSQAKLNGAIRLLCKIIKIVVGLAFESEITSAFLNTHEAIPIRCTLEELDCKKNSNSNSS